MENKIKVVARIFIYMTLGSIAALASFIFGGTRHGQLSELDGFGNAIAHADAPASCSSCSSCTGGDSASSGSCGGDSGSCGASGCAGDGGGGGCGTGSGGDSGGGSSG